MMSAANSIFGVPIFEGELENFADHQQYIIDFCYELQRKDTGIERSNKGGWHSSDQLHRRQHPQIKWLMSEVFKYGVGAIKSVAHDKAYSGIKMQTSWININPGCTWNAPHMHMPAEWSGVVYIKVSENPDRKGNQANDGDIMFFDPMPLGITYNRKPVISRTPAVGKILIFPGYLLHMVAPHFEDEDRISIAFNFKLLQKEQ